MDSPINDYSLWVFNFVKSCFNSMFSALRTFTGLIGIAGLGGSAAPCAATGVAPPVAAGATPGAVAGVGDGEAEADVEAGAVGDTAEGLIAVSAGFPAAPWETVLAVTGRETRDSIELILLSITPILISRFLDRLFRFCSSISMAFITISITLLSIVLISWIRFGCDSVSSISLTKSSPISNTVYDYH
ncbi:MAG: hypothetical protein ACFFBS_00370 [Promethearchaeota archaeon]